jgi:hypothetical protein
MNSSNYTPIFLWLHIFEIKWRMEHGLDAWIFFSSAHPPISQALPGKSSKKQNTLAPQRHEGRREL